MKLSFLYNNNPTDSRWSWPSCHRHPKTISFRNNDAMFKTINSASSNVAESRPEPAFTNSSESASASFSTLVSEDITEPKQPESIEMVIRGLKSSKRFIFEQKGETNSILEEADNDTNRIHGQGFMLLSMESEDPCFDFKKSMEEMVEAHGLKIWEDLEKLLSWYLRVNGKNNRGYIFEAFVDLLVGLFLAEHDTHSNNVSSSTATNTTSTSCSCSDLRESASSSLSFYSSCSASDEPSSVPFVCSLGGKDEDEDKVYDDNTPSRLSSLIKTKDKIRDVAVDGYV